MSMQTYVSLLIFTLSATMTFFTSIPSFGVCFVIKRWPTIFSTMGKISLGLKLNIKSIKVILQYETIYYFLVMWTPPLNPLSKCPKPRPPAKICALMTYSLTSKNLN